MTLSPVIAVLSVVLTLDLVAQSSPTQTLKATPKTVVVGYYDATTPPVLRIHSGEIVDIETTTGSPGLWESLGVPPDQIQQSNRDIDREVKERGPGVHILTGPIYIDEAEPGDVLQVEIQSVRLVTNYAVNVFDPARGLLEQDFPYVRIKLVRLDRDRMVARFVEGVEIPLRPFFGSMGVAPPPYSRRISSAPPWIHAGNMDNKELVAGTTLFIPVHTKGALFQVGDGHAGQGNGEVDLSAIETALNGTFRFVVRKDIHLRWPRAETPTHYITMGFHENLEEATKTAVREMVDFLVNEKHLTRDDAYMLCSMAVDLSITQVVDGRKGVHAMIAKALFVAGGRD